MEIEVTSERGILKVKITTTIDSDLKTLFDTFTSVHKKSYQDVLEQGMRETLIDCKNSTLIDAEIEEKRHTATTLLQEAEALATFRDKLGELKIEIPGNNNNGSSAEAEKRRESLFTKMTVIKEINSKTKGKIIVQPNIRKIIEVWDSGDALVKWNWNTLIEKYGFKDKDEAVSWFDKKIRELAEKQAQESINE